MKSLNTLVMIVLWGGVRAQVGIGTISPSNALDIETSATATAIDLNNTGTTLDPKINFQISGTSTFSMGIDNSDADKFKIGTSALETSTRLTIDAAGNCGIGNTAPTALLDADGSAIFNESGAAKNFRVESDNNTAMLYVNGTNDRVGIGTTAPTDKLDVKGGSLMVETGYGIKSYNGVGPGVTSYMTLAPFNVDFYSWGGAISNSQGFRFYSVDALEFQIGNDGVYSRQKMAIGTTSLAYTLTVNGQPGANGYTAFTNYSDSRLKTNISSLDTGALSKILQLRPVSFQYNQKYLQLYPNSDLQKVHKGFIAQEIRQVFPEMVSEMAASPDGVQYLDLDVSHLQVYLVKALQEQQAIINAQKTEIDALKQNALKVAELENKMNAMLLLLNNK